MLLERGADDGLRFLNDLLEVLRGPETFRVDLVDVLRPARAGGEPAVGGGDLQTADRGVVAGRAGELRGDRIAGERGRLHCVRGQLLERGLLLRRSRGIDARVVRRAELVGEAQVVTARI